MPSLAGVLGGALTAEKPPARARLFIALDLPEEPRRALAAWRDRALADCQDLRPVPLDALHITLVFLGNRLEQEVETVVEHGLRAEVADLPAPVLVPTEVVPIPRRRPRLFALDLADGDGGAQAVHAAVSRALTAASLYEPERRPFWPHLTLARVRGTRRRSPPGRDVPALRAAPPPAAPLICDRVTLYRSHLSPHGARYEPLARTRLRTAMAD
ncbi:MAG TPA: RNA 2',3'-cyclic phosphodiesterase [Thermoleophilaceae bacterium]|nr:RNA 2',3'-cyclic phosphodiesterase [Thermoleophilaceae bacterium]